MAMAAPILFVSDLHLDATRPDITKLFLEFLEREASGATALYILGDLFETWIGDDDPDPDKQRIQAALKRLTAGGVSCFVMHGNRDFLLGARFAANTGCSLIDDPTTRDIFGQRVLLLHGDLLCTDDHAYQRLRRVVRNPLLQWIMRRLSLKQRRSLAAKMRAGSREHIDSAMQSAAQIMDVNPDAVAAALQRYGVSLIVHGHTHRPAVHHLAVAGGDAVRIVLGDWYTQGSVLKWTEHGYELLTLQAAE